jgi:ribonuclease HI
MLADPHAVQISVDGSCFPNEKRRSGYAGIVVYPDDPTEIEVAFQGFRESTINRMELAACIAAMDWVKEEGIGRRYSRVQIFSDSQYVVDRQFSAPYWQKAKWRNSAGRPVENWALWKDFLSSKANAGVRVDRENRFVFEVFDEGASAYLSKHFAYCTPEIGSQMHRQRGFRVRMNDKADYPQVIEVIEEVPLPKAQKRKSSSLPPPGIT